MKILALIVILRYTYTFICEHTLIMYVNYLFKTVGIF